VLLMTGHADEALMKRAATVTDLAILEKPFSPADLVQAVRAAAANAQASHPT
jgi:FixJ family two-component response regulator